MKKTLLFSRLIAIGLIMLFSSGWAFGQGVFISQNCDPNDNWAVDRFAEIYNPTDAAVDLTGWTLENVQAGSVAFTWTLSGSIASGEALICGNADATSQTITPDFTATWVGNSFNGKGGDGTILKNADGDVVDNAVQLDATGKFENGQMVRSSSITTPTITYNATEWTFTSITNAVDATPGTHTCDLPVSTSPTITVSTATLTGFTYIEGNGPSAEQSFDLTGDNLTANISIAAPTNYEISTATGGSFVATNPITLTEVAGSISATIYTRLKAGLTEADYNDEVITATSTDATDKTVTCSGSVTNPSLTITGPNGGEIAYAGQTYDIEWTSSSYTGTVDIEYYDGTSYTTIADDEIDDGTYSFTLPSDIAPGTTYKIRVSDDMTSITTFDESDADFEVKSSIYLTGTMNAWVGDVMMIQEELGTHTWKYTYQETVNTAIEFKYRGNAVDWTHGNWGRGDVVAFGARTDWWNDPSNNGTLTATLGKYYTYIFKDVAVGANGEGYVFETTAEPITLDVVSQMPEYALATDPVLVTVTASADPSSEEMVYVRYTTDNWSTSSYLPVIFVPTTATGAATIPAQAAGTDVEYYVLSTCVADISSEANADLATLNYNNNSTTNYSYTVLGENTLIISQYYEGASNDKYIEIYNVGSETVDLSSYYLARWSGTATPTGGPSNYSALTGSIAAGESQIYMNSSSVNPTYAVTAATATTTACFFNGDDPVALTRTGTDWDDRVDCIYAAGTWGSDKSFYRKGTVKTGNTAISVLDGSGEWLEASLTEVADALISSSEYLSAHFLSTTWIGAVDSDWSNAGNWSNGVPTSDYDVFVPSGATVVIAGSVGCNIMEIAAGGSVTVEAGGTLTPNATTGGIIINSDLINGSGSLIVNGTLNSVTMKNTALAPSSTITYNRYIDDAEWHLLSAPVTGQSINGVLTNVNNSILFADPDYSMKNYDVASDTWNALFTATTSGNMMTGSGYAVKRTGAGTITMEGEYAGSPTTTSLLSAGNRWNLLGNPYPSAIAANSTPVGHGTDNFLTANASSLDPSYTALYVWDYVSASYLIINHISASPVTTLSQDYLQAGQGFFVKAKDLGLKIGVSVAITSAMQSHQPTVAFKSDANAWPVISLKAKSDTKEASTQIAFNTLMTKGLDSGYDGGLFTSNPEFALYSRLVEDNGVDFMLQALPEDYDNLVIPIGLNAKAGEMITFSAKSLNIPEDYAVVLEDRAMNVFTDLSDDAEYAIQLNNDSEGIGRFFVRTSMKSTLGLGDIEKAAFQVFTSVNDNQLVIRGESTSNTVARIYSITGKQVASVNLQQAAENRVQFNEEAGVYIVQISNEFGTYTQKFSWVK